MPFGMVSGVDSGMCVLDAGVDRRRRGGSFGVNVGHHVQLDSLCEGRRHGSSQITLGVLVVYPSRSHIGYLIIQSLTGR